MAKRRAPQRREHTDVEVENHSTVALLRANTPEATDWIEEHCFSESWQYMGSALAVEPRYLPPIIAGLREDGFTVSAGGAAWL
jgi:hypothetical protein